jgi:hypothetical protein
MTVVLRRGTLAKGTNDVTAEAKVCCAEILTQFPALFTGAVAAASQPGWCHVTVISEVARRPKARSTT